MVRLCDLHEAEAAHLQARADAMLTGQLLERLEPILPSTT